MNLDTGRMLRSCGVTCLALATFACGGDGVRDTVDEMMGTTNVSFATLQDTIFTPKCAIPSCHVGVAPQEGLNLSAGQAHANLVGVASNQLPALSRVEPFDPDASYMYLKIIGDPQIANSQMPLVGGPLSTAEQADIRTWILEGAENN